MKTFEKLFDRLIEHHGEDADQNPKTKKIYDASLGSFLTSIGDSDPLYATIERKVKDMAASETKTEVEENTEITEARKKYGKVNPWAVCTKSVGRDDKKKYEKCVKGVKKKHEVAK